MKGQDTGFAKFRDIKIGLVVSLIVGRLDRASRWSDARVRLRNDAGRRPDVVPAAWAGPHKNGSLSIQIYVLCSVKSEL